ADRDRGDAGAEGEQQPDQQRLVGLAAGCAPQRLQHAPRRQRLASTTAHNEADATPRGRDARAIVVQEMLLPWLDAATTTTTNRSFPVALRAVSPNVIDVED